MSAKIIYKSYNQNDSLLFPMSLGELIPENHPVRTVSAIIYRLDISRIESKGKAWQWANTRKGYWRISKSSILTRSITNDRLILAGYPSILNLYIKLHRS